MLKELGDLYNPTEKELEQVRLMNLFHELTLSYLGKGYTIESITNMFVVTIENFTEDIVNEIQKTNDTQKVTQELFTEHKSS